MYNRAKSSRKFGLIKRMEVDCIRLASLRESMLKLEKSSKSNRTMPTWKSIRKNKAYVS